MVKEIKKVLMFVTLMFCGLTMFAACKLESSISISAEDDVQTLQPGQSVQLGFDLSDEKLSKEELVYLVEGSATVTADGLLTANADAVVGSQIEVFAKIDGTKSNTLIFTVAHIHISELELSSPVTELSRNGEAVLNVLVLPTNVTLKGYSFSIESGSEYADIIYSPTKKEYALKIKNVDFEEGTTVVVRVTADNDDTIYSELEFTLVAPAAKVVTVGQDNYVINLKVGAANPNLNAMAYDNDFIRIANQQFIYEVINGDEFLEVDANGNLNGIGHGTASVRVFAGASDVYTDAHVTVINPPQALTFADQLLQRKNINYSYSMANKFAFEASAIGDKTSRNVTYTFSKDGATGDSVAVYNYDTNEVQFKQQGIVTITATSNSSLNGVAVNPLYEASVSFKVNVNNGINVTTYEQFRETLNNKANAGKIVNIVSDLRPTAQNLAAGVAANSIVAEGDRIIYGNNYSIDVSGQALTNGSASLMRFRIMDAGSFTTKIYDLKIFGNYGVAGDLGKSDVVNDMAIEVMGHYQQTVGSGEHAGQVVNAYAKDVVISNVHISGFKEAIQLRYVVNGLVTDSSVENIFQSGIALLDSIAEVKNMTYRSIGGFGLYIAPRDNFSKSGPNFDQVSKVKVSGYTESHNLNTGATTYLNAFAQTLAGAGISDSIPNMLASSLIKYISDKGWSSGSEEAVNIISHFRNSNEQYNLYALIFLDSVAKLMKWPAGNANNEIVEFSSDELMGSIIKLKDLDGTTVNTTHRFITTEIVTNMPGFGPVVLGQMMLVNLNYIPA